MNERLTARAQLALSDPNPSRMMATPDPALGQVLDAWGRMVQVMKTGEHLHKDADELRLTALATMALSDRLPSRYLGAADEATLSTPSLREAGP